MSIFSRFQGRSESKQPVRVKEIIGRVSYHVTNAWARFRSHLSLDQTQPDYEWWDKFRRGKQSGFEFAGLFAKPISEIVASWVLGDVIEAQLVEADDYTDNLLKKFMKRIHGKLITIVIDIYGLGDQYIIVNPDGSLSVPSPELVHVVYDPLDYRKMTKVTITSRLPDAQVTDVYTDDARVITIKWTNLKDTFRANEVYEFANLIGKIPIVHLANDRSGNETNGRPIYEALFKLYDRYNNLIEKMIDGAELMGNPFPVFEGVDDLDETIDANKTSPTDTFLNEDGVEEDRVQIDFDQLPAIFVGRGGRFTFASPGNGFTDDIRNTLKSLFMLLTEHTRIPEAVWGLELSSARATAQEQMKTFYMYIVQKRLQLQGLGADEDLQAEAEGGLLELCDIWLRMRALTDSKVKVAPVVLKWSELAQEDAELAFNKNESAHNKGVITDETYLANLGIVEDAQAEIADAEDQMTDEGDRFEQDIQDALNAERDPMPEAA